MISLRIRRRARVLCLRGLRVLRKHHLSLLSLTILGAALTIALTSSSFELEGKAPSEAAAAAAPGPEQTSDTGFVSLPSTSDPKPRSVVFYFVSSQKQIDDMHQALHRDLVDPALAGYAPLHDVTRVFVLIEDYRDEGDALELIRQQAASPTDDYVVQMVDLR